MNHEQYVLDGYYPRSLRGSGLPESEDDLAFDESEFRLRPEPRRKPIGREEHDRIVRKRAALLHEMNQYRETIQDTNSDREFVFMACPVCGVVRVCLYWSGRCPGCIRRELRKALKDYRSLAKYKAIEREESNHDAEAETKR